MFGVWCLAVSSFGFRFSGFGFQVSGFGRHHFLLGVLVGRLPLGAHLEDLPDAHRQNADVLELLDPELREVVAAARSGCYQLKG